MDARFAQPGDASCAPAGIAAAAAAAAYTDRALSGSNVLANPRKSDTIKRSLSESNVSAGSNSLYDTKGPTWKHSFPQVDKLHSRASSSGAPVDSYFGGGVGDERTPLSSGMYAFVDAIPTVVTFSFLNHELDWAYDANANPCRNLISCLPAFYLTCFLFEVKISTVELNGLKVGVNSSFKCI